MTTINPSLYSGQYYQLPTTGTTTPTATSVPTPVDAAALQATNLDSAYLLDLSPDAQNYLNGIGSSTNTTNTNSDASSSSDSFILTPAQQQKLTGILEEFKGQPLTQENYQKLQDELKSAGISPDQLAAKDQATNFDATQIFINALNGIDTPLTSASDKLDAEQTKANNYLSKIVQEWQSVSPSSAINDASSDNGSTSVSA